jgi:hypothetical protein
MKSPKTPVAYPEWVQTDSEKKLHDDFRYFLWFILRHLGLKPTLRQYAVALWLQHGPRRSMTQGFRGLGKSWITAAFVLWRLYRNPNERILVVSANEYKATEFATFTRRLIDEIELLQFLRPREGQRDSVLAFDVGPSEAHQAPSVRAAGITGGITGGRASLIVADDIENPKNSLTEVMREKLAEAIKEFDAILMPGGDVVYLGTPQTEQSVYRLLEGRGYKIRIWPALYPTPEQRAKYGGNLAPDIAEDLDKNPALAGHSTDPERFTDMDLAERRASYGASGFALQFMLDTSLSDALRYPLRTSDFICMDVDLKLAPAKLVWTSDPRNDAQIDNVGFNGDRLYRPMYASDTMLPYQGRIMVIDPSGRGKNETAYVVLFHMAGQLFLKATGGFTDGYGEATLQGLANVARDHEVNEILIESNFGDGMFLALLAPVVAKTYPVTLTEVKAAGQKERRIIEDLEPVLNQHRLVIDAACAKADILAGTNSLLYQLTHITRDRDSLKQDDRVDILAHGVRYFRAQLQQDAQAAEAAHLEAEREKMRREFIRQWYGGKDPRQGFSMTNRALRR